MIADQKAIKSMSLFGYSLILCKNDVDSKNMGGTYADIALLDNSVSLEFYKPMNEKAALFTVAVKDLIVRDIKQFMSIDDAKFAMVVARVEQNKADGDPTPHIEPVFGVFENDDDKKEIMYG